MSKKLFTNASFFMPTGRFEPRSLLVEEETIAAVLQPGEEASAETIDLGGRCVIPGFIDSHIHLLPLALKELRCDLSTSRSAGDIVEALAAWAEENDDEIVVGVEWDESNWDERVVPTREMLDTAVPDRPAFARRICLHAGVVNTAFLKLLHGHEEFINRDTGFITEDALYEATRLSHPPADAIAAAMEGGIGALHRLGITAIHDIVLEHNYDAYLAGIRSSQLPLRIDALYDAPMDAFDRLAERAADIDDKFFRPAGIKIFSDGSLGGRTAALNSPYSDAHTIGEFLIDEKELSRQLRFCLEKGIACAVHAIGDRALRTVLLEMIQFPDAGVFRVEHVELAGWDEIQMLKKAPVYLFVQPNFVRNWQAPGGIYEARLGKSRWERCNLFGSFAANGIPFAFGSDGMPPGPLYGIKGATEHPIPAERLSVADAIRRYTETAPAFGPHRRNTGRLEKGCPADLAVLSGDPLAEDLDNIQVDRTYFGGTLVFDRETA